MQRQLAVLSAVLCLAATATAAAAVSDFEDLGLNGESFYNGSDGAGGFSDAGVFFINSYDAAFDAWEGFAYSNTTDMTTAGFANQYSAIAGRGVNASAIYAVAFMGYAGNLPRVIFPQSTRVYGVYVTNTTYAYLSMRDGDVFAKQFGGESGEDPDWFRVTATGRDSAGNVTGTAAFYLADFRFEDPTRDYIVGDWRWMNLAGLGEVASIEFALSSSDAGAFGMNTPAYFALDNLNDRPAPRVDIQAGGSDDPVTVSFFAPPALRVRLDPLGYGGVPATYWVVLDTPQRVFSLVSSAGGGVDFMAGFEPLGQAPLQIVAPVQLPLRFLPLGKTTAYFGVATDADGDGVTEHLWWDAVEIDTVAGGIDHP